MSSTGYWSGREMSMSLYERTDRYVSSRSKDNLEYLAVYAVCFCVFLLPVAVRRLKSEQPNSTVKPSIFSETGTIAANCATSSFMGS